MLGLPSVAGCCPASHFIWACDGGCFRNIRPTHGKPPAFRSNNSAVNTSVVGSFQELPAAVDITFTCPILITYFAGHRHNLLAIGLHPTAQVFVHEGVLYAVFAMHGAPVSTPTSSATTLALHNSRSKSPSFRTASDLSCQAAHPVLRGNWSTNRPVVCNNMARCHVL